jgi:hypothetical protein
MSTNVENKPKQVSWFNGCGGRIGIVVGENGEHVVMQEMLMDGFVAIANGENPRLIESRLKGYYI